MAKTCHWKRVFLDMTLFLAQVMPQLDGMDVSKLCDGGQYLSFTVPSHLHIILVTTSGPICTLCSGKPLPPKGGSGVGIYRPGRGYPQVNVQMGSGCFSMAIWRLHTGRRECAPRAIYTIQNSSHRDSESSSPNLHVLLRSPKTVQSTPPNIH